MSDQSDYQKRVNVAAENYGKYNTVFEDEFSNDKRAFEAGAAFVQANPPPEVLALADALKLCIEQRNYAIEIYNLNPMVKEMSVTDDRAEEALANFQKTRGGK